MIATTSPMLANLQLLPVYAGFLAAILNFDLICMSRISSDCTIVFPTLENMDVVVGILSISQCFAMLQVLPIYADFWQPSWISLWYDIVFQRICGYLIILRYINVLIIIITTIIPGFMVAILKFLLISMPSISADCTILSKNIGEAVGLRWYLNVCLSYKNLRCFSDFPAEILDFYWSRLYCCVLLLTLWCRRGVGGVGVGASLSSTLCFLQ